MSKGKLETKNISVSWTQEGITILKAPGFRELPVSSERTVVQLTWWRHEVKLGMLGRMFKRKTHIEPFLHVDVRVEGKHQLSMRARVPDTAILKDLPQRRAGVSQHVVEYEKVAALVEAARAAGCELVNPRPEQAGEPPLVAMPELDAEMVELEEGQSLGALIASGKRAIRLPEGTFELDSVNVEEALLIEGAGENLTTIISTADRKWGFQVMGGHLGLRNLTLQDADTPNKGLILITVDGKAALKHCHLVGDPDDAGAKGILVEDYGQLYMDTSELTGVYFALTIQGASQAVLINNRFEKSFVGVRVSERAEAKILGNVCFDNTTGLSIKGQAAAIVDGNSFVFNQVQGLEIAGDCQVAVFRNLCEGNNRGIIVRSSQPFPLENNRVLNNEDVGIQLLSPNPLTVRGNTCRWNTHGIEVTDPHCEAVVENNIISDNERSGIRICVGAPITARNNTLERNEKGIQVEHVIGGGAGEGPLLENNVIQNNRAEGILFEGGGRARRNSVSRNSVSIKVSTASHVELQDNQED